MAPHGPATVIGSAGRMWYKLSWWELAPGLWGKKCSPLVRWAGMIVSRASVFPLLAWRKIKLRSVKQHLLSYCCQIYILASSATQGGNVLVFFGSSNYVTAAHDWNNSKTSLSPCSQNSLGSFWIYGFPFLCSLPTIWVSPVFLLHDAAQDRFPPPPVKYIQTVLALLLFPVLCPCPPGSLLCLVPLCSPQVTWNKMGCLCHVVSRHHPSSLRGPDICELLMPSSTQHGDRVGGWKGESWIQTLGLGQS